LNRDIHLIWGDVNPFLVFAFYYLNDEIFEFIIGHSAFHYILSSGWLNLMEWTGIGMAYASYLGLGKIVTTMPDLLGDPYRAQIAHRVGHILTLFIAIVTPL